MTKLSSISDNHLVLNCRCGHVGQIAVADLIEVYGGDVEVGAVERAARCSRCKTKSIASSQIIYVGNSFEALSSGHIKDNSRCSNCRRRGEVELVIYFRNVLDGE